MTGDHDVSADWTVDDYRRALAAVLYRYGELVANESGCAPLYEADVLVTVADLDAAERFRLRATRDATGDVRLRLRDTS